MHAFRKTSRGMILVALLFSGCVLVLGNNKAYARSPFAPIRFDLGTTETSVADGYKRLGAEDSYSPARGYGWESSRQTSRDFRAGLKSMKLRLFEEFQLGSLDNINSDGVTSADDLVFRIDVPNGDYRVTVTVGDMTKALGSIDVAVNGEKIGDQIAAWSPGGTGTSVHRMLMRDPFGWWNPVRGSVAVKDGVLRISLKKNQSYYDHMMATAMVDEQAWEDSFIGEPKQKPYGRVGMKSAPYYYIGWPFAHNSIMAIEIFRDEPLPLVAENGKLKLTAPIDSPGLKNAIKIFNSGKLDEMHEAWVSIKEPDAQLAKSILTLHIAGHLSTEFKQDESLVAWGITNLERHLSSHPEDVQAAELLEQAKLFKRAWDIHENRGSKNHFIENCNAICWWWMIPETSPLYDQARLHIARAEHMLIPYFPARGTYRDICEKLEKKYANNRFVRYHLHEEWNNFGDGSDYYDWYIPDYSKKVQNSPEWVKQLYPAFQQTIDWSEWWIKFKQRENGAIGGGWGDDVEIVGLFGYMGFVSHGISDL
ncbi:hypothetical protein ACFL1X_13775, partial [Candidatus Hydrogenedentota bacterium]